MNDRVLVLNSGSSSIKFSLYARASDELQRQQHGQISRLYGRPTLIQHNTNGTTEQTLPTGTGHDQALAWLLEQLALDIGQASGLAVGHRVVHGGTRFTAPVRVNDSVLEELQAIESLAPLHQPYNVAAIRTIHERAPDVPQVACFDTAFHAGHDKPVNQFALPGEYHDKGIRRYGFHGLSYEYIADRLQHMAPAMANERVIVAHLGNGASLCALQNGKSIDTSMGFSTLEGLMMGTRCGRLDPGVLLYLLQTEGLDIDQVTELLYKQSGLKGVSDISHDMRDLIRHDTAAAREAIDLYIDRLTSELGVLLMRLRGLDGLVFTGGVGEHQPLIRRRVCERLDWLGVRIEDAANDHHDTRISTDDSDIGIYCLQTDEEVMIARHTRHLLS